MAAARESFLVKLLLFISCSSIAVVTCQSQGFTCFSSTDCHGNKVDRNISVIAECCAIDAGLSFKENAGDCGNCFTDEKFESQGDEFYLSIFSNYEPSEYFRIGKLRLAVEPVGREMTTFMVDALGAQTVYTAPKEVSMDSGLLDLESVSTRDKAIFVKSEAGDPLSVVAYVEEFQSSDTFKVFPCVAQPVAAYEYYAVSVPQSFIVLPTDPDYLDYEDVLDPQGNSAIVIVTTEENTVLNVTLTQNVSISGASDIVGQIGTDSLRSDEQVSFQLSARGSTLYLASLDDLTGSRVVSNKPIAFITGHECGTLPHNIQYCDHLVEQITPTSTWGRQFIISTIATRKDFDTFRIIASRSDTSVSVACTITDVPPLNLNTDGSFIEFHINSTDSCYLESNQPILLAQFSVSSLVDRVFNSDPFLVIIPPVEQYRSNYVFNTFTGTRSLFRSGQNYVNILLPAGVGHEGLRLDEQPLSDDASVTSILCTSSDTVCATTVQLTVSDDRHNLNHIDDGAQFSAIVYWLSYRVAHGYSAGMTQNPIALPSVSLQTSKFVVFENESVVAILLTRTGDTSVPATVFVSAAEISDGGNALSGEDFVAVSQTAVEFGPNEHLVTVMIDIVDDVFPENTEEFEVFLSTSPGVYIVSPAYANVTILNDDPPLPVMNVSFAETTIEVMEGIGLVTFTLEKTMGALGPVAVRIFTTSGSAVDGDDFVAIDDVITFEIEDLQATIFTLVLDNLSLEGVEEFTAHIEPVVGDFPVAVQNSSATVSIRDNDVVVLGFEQPTYTVSEENDQLVVSVSISHGSLERSVVATVETISGSAVDNDDFVPVTRVLSFDSFTTEQSITISIINDNQVEVNEEFNIRVVTEEEDSSNIIVSPDEAVVTIVDTDRVEIDLLPIATTVREGEGSARVNVSVMEGRLGGPVSISLTTFNINTTGGVDYTEVSTEITLSLSNPFQEVLIPISDDTVYDGPEDEKFLITATIKSGQNTDRIDVPISSQTITIVDNEPRPIAFVQFSETSYTTVENAQEIVLLVESDGINYDLFTVDYTYQSGEAQDGSDIILPNGSLQFPPGSTTAAITVPIIDDGVAELAETFTVQLASRDAILMTNSTTVTIIDNDVVNVGFGQMVYSVTEEQNAEVVLTIAKTTLTDRTVSVMFSTLDGTALAGVDYEQLNQVLTFSPNENTREVTVRILNNEIQEPGSRLFFGQLRSLSSSDVNISLPTASILVADDDQSNIPSRPLNFEASPQATAVEFTWNQPSIDTIDNYVLMWTYLSPCERGSPQSVPLDGTARQYILEGLEENSSYSFRLQARNSAGIGPEALQVVTTRTAAPSGTPQSLRSVSATPTSITVEWSDINCLDQNGAITSYDVRVNGRVALTTSQIQATITGLTSSTTYFIDVRGNNSIGGGPFSPTSVIMTAGAENVTIGFDRNVYFVTEGEAAVLSVVLSEPVSVPITVGVSTIDGTAEESEDYVFSDVIVTFSAGETLQLISILTVDDNIGESNETFGVVFSSLPPNNINIGTFPFSTIVITDDDERFAVECIQTSVGPSGPIQIACIPMNGEVESVQCDYNNGLTDEPCGLGITLNLNQFEPGPLSLTITVTSTEGDLTTLVFNYTVPEPLSLTCSLSAVSGRVTVSCTTNRDLFLPPFCNLTGFGVIEPCDLDNIELNVVDLPPGPYNLTIIVVDVLELTATETIGLFLSEPLFNAACVLNGSVAMCMSSLDGTLVPVLYECSYDGGDRQPCEPPFSTTEESLETGPHILTIFASTSGGQTLAIELPFIVPDINECIMGTDDCVDDATCVNTVGSFTCTCPSGFSGDGRASPVGSGCTDIDECTMGTDDCVDNATCANTVGSFTCTCPSGFSGNGRASLTGCTNINDCIVGTHDCVDGSMCLDTVGSFTCMCPPGFRGDGRASGTGCQLVTMITCESTEMLQSTLITCTSNRPLSEDPPPLCAIGSAAQFCVISNIFISTDTFPAGELNLTITARDRQGFVIVHTFPFVLIECEPLGAVRLVGGSNAMEGRVEVCDGVVWGTVCDDVWDNQDAMVVCRQLGFPAQGAIARDGALFGEGSGPIVLDNVQCSGSESMILDCTANDIGVHNCDHSEDAGVTCQPSSPSPSPTPPPSPRPLDAKAPSSKGNEFVLAFWSNGGQANIPKPTIALFVTTDDSDPVSFTVEAPNVPTLFPPVTNMAVAGQTTVITLPTNRENPTVESQDIRVFQELQRNKGIRVKAEAGKNISVYGLNDDDVSTDAFLALPCVDYGENAPDDYVYYVFSADVEGTTEQFSSRFMIVPCEDGTEINLIPTRTLTISADISSTGFAVQIGPTVGIQEFTISLDSLETAMFQSPNDLTGTILESNKPITVLVGHECGQVPIDVTACDVLVEQVPPHIAYGTVFLTAPLQFRESGERYRIGSVSNSPNEVTVTCTSERGGTPENRLSQTLTRGQYAEFDTSGDRTPNPTDSYRREYCCIESSLPVTVMQYTKGHSLDEVFDRGDPAMLYVPPVTQYLNDFTLTTARQVRTTFQGFLSYTISSRFFTDPIVDGRKLLVNGTMFNPDGGYSPIYCSDTSIVCGYGAYSALPQGDHAIIYDQAGAGFYPFVYGLDIEISFEYPSGFELEPEGLPVIEIPDRTVPENIGMIEIPIRRVGGDLGFPSLIVVSSRDTGSGIGDAIAGSDYEAIQPTNQNYPGHRLRYQANMVDPRSDDTLSITIINDDDRESTETFEIYLVEVRRNAFVSKPIGTVTILDDDSPPEVGFNPIEYNVEERQGFVDLIIETNSGVRLRDGGVLFFTNDGSAVSSGADVDYTATPQANAIPVTFPDDDDPFTTIIRVPINNDDIVENTENFFGRLVVDPNIEVEGLVITEPDATVNIIDQDIVTIGFDPTSYAVSETEGSATLNIKVFSGRTSMDILVDFTTQSDSAVSPDDFIATTQTLTFGPGVTSLSVDVPIIDDDIFELSEFFNGLLSLGDPIQSSFVTISEPTARVEIISDDTVTIGFVPDSYSVAETTGEVTLTVQIVDGQLERSVDVDFTTSDGSATSVAPIDFIDPGRVTLQFSNQTTSQTVRIVIEDDDILENDENFFGNLATLDGSVILDPEQAEVNILEDNDEVTIGFDPESYIVGEADGSATLTVRLISGTLERNMTVFFETNPGTAGSDQDYSRTTSLLTFTPTVSSRDVDVPILQDDIVETDETFFGSLDPQGQPAFVAPSEATVTILDNDGDNVTIGFERIEYSVDEGDQVEVCVVVRSGTLERDAVVRASSVDDSAAAGEDYDAISGLELIFSGTVGRNCFNVTTTEDGVLEIDETFTLVLDTDDDSVILDPEQATVQIIDDDTIEVGLEETEYTTPEGDVVVEVCAVVISGSLQRDAVVTLQTQDISATAGVDYVTLSSNLTFTATQNRICRNVNILDDVIYENNETIRVFLETDDGDVTIVPDRSEGMITINDNDGVVIGFEETNYATDEPSPTLEVCVVLNNGTLGRDVVVTASTEDDTAQSPADYNETIVELTFNIDDPIGTRRCFNIPINNDTLLEGTEQFIGNLATNEPRVDLNPDRAVIRILDADVPPTTRDGLCSDGDVRLRDGDNELEGRVEVCFNGEWGTVCDDSWDDDDAAVVCRQLGFSDQGALAIGDGFFGLGEDSILLDEVQCVGNEARLIDCPRANDMMIGQHDCIHFEDAGVECQKN